MGGTRTENGGQDEREEYGTVDLHAERHGLVPGPGRRRIPGQGFRPRHRDRRHDALGQPPAVSCNVLFEDGKVIGWEAVNGF